jgi:hypothetical protein
VRAANACGLQFSARSNRDKRLVLQALNVPYGQAQELLKAAEGKALHVPMTQRIREGLSRREKYELNRSARR